MPTFVHHWLVQYMYNLNRNVSTPKAIHVIDILHINHIYLLNKSSWATYLLILVAEIKLKMLERVDSLHPDTTTDAQTSGDDKSSDKGSFTSSVEARKK